MAGTMRNSSREDIPRANALHAISFNMLLIAGPAAAGVIVAFFGTSPAFLVDAVTFFVAAGILGGVAAGKSSAPAGTKKSYLQEFREGITYILQAPLMRRLIPLLALLVFVGSMQSPLIVVFVKTILLKGDIELGILMSAMGVGGILGGLVTAGLGSKAGRPGIISWLFIAEGILLVVFALNRNYSLGLVIFVLFGTLGAALHIILMSLFQTHIPEEKRGRVFANLTPILGPLSIVSIGLGTFIADIVGVTYVLVVSGGMECLGGVYGVLRKISGIHPVVNADCTPREKHPSSK